MVGADGHRLEPIGDPRMPVPERGLRTYFEDLDLASVEALEARFRGQIPESRIVAMGDLPTRFDSPEGFEAAYREAAGKTPEDGVMGFSRGLEASAHVRVDEADAVPEITMHERVHQAGHPEAERILGPRLYEGVTQDLALRTARLDPEIWPARGYPEETRAAARLRETCGSDAVEAAYFRGDARGLHDCLERCMLRLPDLPVGPQSTESAEREE